MTEPKQPATQCLEELLAGAVMSKFSTAQECVTYRNAIRDCMRALKSAESETGRWINSSDRLPEYADCEKASGYVLAWFKGCKHPEVRHYTNVREWQIGDDPIPHSYWMPLPEVPNV